MKILKILIVIFAVTAIFIVSFAVRNRVLDNKIKTLNDIYAAKKAIADNMATEINAADSRSEYDKVFLETMFHELFTFYDENDFKSAKEIAGYYNLPDGFIDSFYDMSELANNGYADMLDILCEYKSSNLCLINRKDNIGYYVATVTLSTVKYNSDFDIVLFIALADSGAEHERVKSIVYYNTK